MTTEIQPKAADRELSAYSVPAYRSTPRSCGELYYSNIARTLGVGGRPMSTSNRLAVVFIIKRTYSSPFSDKGKGLIVERAALV